MRDLDIIERNSENWLRIKNVKYELTGIKLKENEYINIEFVLSEVIDEMKNIRKNDNEIKSISTTAYYETLEELFGQKKSISEVFFIDEKKYSIENSCVDKAFICDIMINGRKIIDTDYYSKLSKNTREWMDKNIYVQ